MENLYAIILSLLFIFPLVVQLQMLIVDPKKLCAVFHYYASNEDATKDSSPQLQQCYPKSSEVLDARSVSRITLTNLRTVSSSPALTCSSASKNALRPIESKILGTKHSSTFVKTGQVLPVVDITWNYSSYRFKVFETCLRNFYGDKYPPGEVVLNSMQLNLLDSSTNVNLGLAVGLFDFVKDSDLALNVSRKLEIDYLNPLNHFVAKRPSQLETAERFTETPANGATVVDTDPIGGIINDREKNAWINRRSLRKIELPCKCNLSSTRRVYEAHDFQLRRNPLLLRETLRQKI